MTPFTDKDFEAIEAAVLETPRGRWFLGEFARRNRAADTLTLLEAIRTLERGISGVGKPAADAEIHTELEDLSRAIASLLNEFTAVAGEAAPAADHKAAVERLQGLAAGLRQPDADRPDPAIIDEIAGQVALLGEAYDLASQRAAEANDRLAHIGARIGALLAAQITSASGPPGAEVALSPENLVYFGGDEDLFEGAAEPQPGPATEAAVAAPSEPTDDVVPDDGGTAHSFGETQQPSPAMEAPLPDIRPTEELKQRIVIVRRRSSDETTIPLADEADAGSVARPASGV